MAAQKTYMIKMIKENNQKLISQLEKDFIVPTLEDYLSKKFAFSTSKVVCEHCQFMAKNLQALSAHHRGCYAKKKNDVKSLNENIETAVNIIKSQEIEGIVKDKKEKINEVLSIVKHDTPVTKKSTKK